MNIFLLTIGINSKSLILIKSLSLSKYLSMHGNGRIQIIKTFAIPKFMFRASQIPLTKKNIKEIDSVFFNFHGNQEKTR